MTAPTITVDRETWEHAQQTGVLLVTMPGEVLADADVGLPWPTGVVGPPSLLVEASEPCETCDGTGFVNCPRHLRQIEGHCDTCWTVEVYPCPDCHNGKRRIEVRVPCCTNQVTCRDFSREHCAWRTDGSADGLVTVGTVVHQWGPLEFIGQTDEPRPIQGAFDRSFITLRHHNGKPFLVRFTQGQRGEGEVLTLPPDVDPASLIGQCAIGGRIEVAG